VFSAKAGISVLSVVSGLGLAAGTRNDAPTLDDVLARTGRYVLGYVREMSVVISRVAS
jgi:hypothetical protein